MRPVRIDASTDAGLEALLGVRRQALLAGKPFVVQVVGEKRSLPQNALSFALYKQIGQQVDDQSIKDIRAECKLVHGIPILRAASDEFRDLYDRVVKPHDYETKLALMCEPVDFPVTSLMNKKQFSEYVDTIIRHYSQQGIVIVHPGEEL